MDATTLQEIIRDTVQEYRRQVSDALLIGAAVALAGIAGFGMAWMVIR